MKQQQQEVAIETEIQGFKKDIVEEQVRAAELAAVRSSSDAASLLVHRKRSGMCC